jgi:hypothetical protein
VIGSALGRRSVTFLLFAVVALAVVLIFVARGSGR